MSWYEWIDGKGEVVGLTRFGASAPYQTIYKELGITVDRVVETARKLVDPSRG
jgi:transketolase